MATEIQTLLTQVESERKRSRIVLTTCGAYTLISIVAVGILSGTRDLVVEEVWPAVVAQAFALALLAWAWKSQFARHTQLDAAASIREITQSGLRQTQSSIRTLKMLALAIPVMVVLLGLAMASLRESGKMDERAIRSMTGLIALIVLINGALMLLKWRRRLKPRRDRFEQILEDLNRQ